MKNYTKPQIEVEVYQLAESIAQNCANVVNIGPTEGGHPYCSEYKDPYESMRASVPKGVNFYDDTGCTCYYTSSGNYFTS